MSDDAPAVIGFEFSSDEISRRHFVHFVGTGTSKSELNSLGLPASSDNVRAAG